MLRYRQMSGKFVSASNESGSKMLTFLNSVNVARVRYPVACCRVFDDKKEGLKMSISKSSMLHEEKRVVTLAVDNYESGIWTGLLFCGQDQQGSDCCGVMDLIHQMDLIFEEMKYPMLSMSQRNFLATEVNLPKAECRHARREGRLATLVIRVRQRQFASWQGVVIDTKTQEQHIFSSFLQLMDIIESVVTGNMTVPSDQGQVGMEQFVREMNRCLMDAGSTVSQLEIKQAFSNTLFCSCSRDGYRFNLTIRIMFQANNTCQGVIYWKEMRQEQKFRSFLELIQMIDQAADSRMKLEQPA